MANKLVLKGNGIELQYTIGNPSLPALTFKEGAEHRSFTPAQIKTEDTSLGQLISVLLTQSADVGGSRFGFFLPAVQVASGQTAAVSTAGAIETFSGPNSVPHRATTWRSVSLHGAAQEVIVLLDHPVGVPAQDCSTPIGRMDWGRTRRQPMRGSAPGFSQNQICRRHRLAARHRRDVAEHLPDRLGEIV